MDAAVVALAVEDEATAKALIEMHGLRFPVGHSADASAVAAATGAFVDSGKGLGFVLHSAPT